MVKLQVNNVSKSYCINRKEIHVLDRINFNIKKAESVVIVGPSGCGKTTLIRIMSGLEQPDNGKVKTDRRVLRGPNKDIMLVFQTFALLPWKTVLENVELGLTDIRDDDERTDAALKYIDLVGLDGFEGTYPGELSNGMKQRVGLARALSRNPSILLMDEPFSGLDPLSANNLRNEVLRLFEKKRTKPDVLITITHNIEEAVIIADRVLIMSQRPSRIIGDIKVNLPKPRNRRSEEFNDLVDEITSKITI